MRIYFSGIGGVGIGPLAEIAHDAGYDVVGSDREESLVTRELAERGIQVYFSQDGQVMQQEHGTRPIDWFVYTSALTSDHPELVLAQKLGIKTAKRDELLAHIIAKKNLKLIAIAGTHGKTTTTGMMVWAMQQLGVPTSYSVGSTLSFGPSGKFDPESEYFVYECDEFDRNFLHFQPWLSIITALDYDHPDTYPAIEEYRDAFVKFLEQSEYSLLWGKDLRYLKHPDIPASYESFDELMNLSHIKLAGDHTRHNAFLVERALERIRSVDPGEPSYFDGSVKSTPREISAINSFPGTSRRFEKLAPNLYSDYGHHPAEIAATLQMASELSDNIVLVYQPHQNIRQHEIKDQYTDDIFKKANKIYWLPTYLSRENPELEILTPEKLTESLSDTSKIHISDMDDRLWRDIQEQTSSGALVLCMGAGTIDGWVRQKLSNRGD